MNKEIKSRQAAGALKPNTGDWLKKMKTLQKENPVRIITYDTENIDGKNMTPLSTQRVIKEMNDQILKAGVMDDCLFTTGVGIHQMVACQLLTWTQPNQMISSGSLGTMGVALGFVIGCMLAHGHKMCIAVDGDGSFNMTFTELKTVAQEKLPVKLLVLDNDAQMMVQYWQRLFHDERFLAVRNTRNPDYVQLAQSFGIKSLYCDREEDLVERMDQFLFEDPEEPVLMHVRVERTPCLPLVAPGQPLQDMILRDDVPFLHIDKNNAPS